MHMRPLACSIALLALACAPAAASAADAGPAYPDASWTQASITEPDGTVLHTDILRDKSVPLDKDHPQPVVLSIGPYFNHSGQLGPAGPAENEATYDAVGPSAGPSDRFADFVEGSGLLKKGYTFEMVDLRSYGGSTGCEDWGGPGEQSDVRTAIEWAASQPWSNGSVGTYGKSYDAMTGLIATDLQPKGLKAVVAQEPVYDDYRYLYGDGMRRGNFAGTPGLYAAIAATPGPLMDAASDPTYNVNGANDVDPNHPGCKAETVAEQSGNSDHYSSYWRDRNFVAKATGSTVPLFLTQGLTENNTVSDGLTQFLANHAGPERGWFGPWEHVRGNETCVPNDVSTGCAGHVGALKMGRAGWDDEVLAFYNQYLKDGPRDAYPNFEVQTNDGKWRSEDQWPPADAVDRTSTLKAGTYADNAGGTITDPSNSVWTFSPPLPSAAHLSGSPTVQLDLGEQYPMGNLVVDVYDLAPSGTSWKGSLITRQAHLIYGNGPLTLQLWSADWKLKKGDRIGIKVTDDNTDWWGDAKGLGQTISVYGGSITLPFLAKLHNQTLPVDTNKPGVQLSSYLSSTAITVPAATVAAGEQPAFDVPPAQQG